MPIPDGACRPRPAPSTSRRSWRALRRDRRAVTTVEYAVIAGFILLVIIIAVRNIGTALLVPLGLVAAALPG